VVPVRSGHAHQTDSIERDQAVGQDLRPWPLQAEFGEAAEDGQHQQGPYGPRSCRAQAAHVGLGNGHLRAPYSADTHAQHGDGRRPRAAQVSPSLPTANAAGHRPASLETTR